MHRDLTVLGKRTAKAVNKGCSLSSLPSNSSPRVILVVECRKMLLILTKMSKRAIVPSESEDWCGATPKFSLKASHLPSPLEEPMRHPSLANLLLGRSIDSTTDLRGYVSSGAVMIQRRKDI